MLSAGFRLFAVLLLAQAAHGVHAQEGAHDAAPAAGADDGGITLAGIEPTERDGFIRFSAQADYRLPAALIAAMNRDTQLVFVTQIQVLAERRVLSSFLPARKIARLQLRRRIGYHSLTRKYIVDDLTFARQAAFNSLDDALDHLGRHRDISVIEKALAAGSGATHVRVRVKLSRTELSLPMQAQSLLPDWWLASDWYQWAL